VEDEQDSSTDESKPIQTDEENFEISPEKEEIATKRVPHTDYAPNVEGHKEEEEVVEVEFGRETLKASYREAPRQMPNVTSPTSAVVGFIDLGPQHTTIQELKPSEETDFVR